MFIRRRINKYPNFLGQSLKLELNLFLKLLSEMRDDLRKDLNIRSYNRLVRLADTPVANLIRVKSKENTNLDRRYSFIDFCFFFFVARGPKVGGSVGRNL